MTFPLVLKQLREERHLSQRDIAEYLGLTRQAIASYELGKREPDYTVLKKLADYFGVSVDYLLGRSICKDINALTVGKNIDLLRGNRSFKEMSEDIAAKTGALIFHDMLESYAKGDRMPFIGTIKILSRYAGVRDSFFYIHNTPETLEKEKELYINETQAADDNEGLERLALALRYLDRDLMQWVINPENIPYVKLAKEMKESGLSPDSLVSLIESIMKRRNTDK